MKKLIAVLLTSVFSLTACSGSGEQVINLKVNEFAYHDLQRIISFDKKGRTE
jgi:hypothetical protein